MIRKAIISMCIILIYVALTGCAHHLNSSSFPVDQNKINGFIASGTVSIDNAQPSNSDFLIYSVSGHEYFANLNQVTETAKNTLKSEISRHGASVIDSGSEKVIKISVTNITTKTTWALRVVLELKAVTGDGVVVNVVGDNYSPRSLDGVLDGAISLAVISLLNDENIRNYLQK